MGPVWDSPGGQIQGQIQVQIQVRNPESWIPVSQILVIIRLIGSYGRLTSNILIIHQISLKSGLGLVPGIPPSQYPTVRATPGTPRGQCRPTPRVHAGCPLSKYGRGAHIRRSTHLKDGLVALRPYDRGL